MNNDKLVTMDDILNPNDSILIGEGGVSQNLCPWIYQGYSDTCAIRCQQIVLRDFGIDISQEKLMDISSAFGWYNGGGTSPEDVGGILELAGVECHKSTENGVLDLINELSQGHRVIVGVDSGELWAKTFMDQYVEQVEDALGFSSADHALIVAGVNVDPHDINNTKVVLTDPGTGSLRVEYSLDRFLDAWKDSNFFMVATDDPAPYQFDPVTGFEEPSCFNTDFEFNDFVVDNGYQLSPDSLCFPQETILPCTSLFNIDYDLGFASLDTEVCFFENDFDTPDFLADNIGNNLPCDFDEPFIDNPIIF